MENEFEIISIMTDQKGREIYYVQTPNNLTVRVPAEKYETWKAGFIEKLQSGEMEKSMKRLSDLAKY